MTELYDTVYPPRTPEGLDGELEGFIKEHGDARLIILRSRWNDKKCGAWRLLCPLSKFGWNCVCVYGKIMMLNNSTNQKFYDLCALVRRNSC